MNTSLEWKLYTTDWCGPCKKLKKDILSKYELVDIVSLKDQDDFDKHNITHVPTVYLNGKLLGGAKAYWKYQSKVNGDF